HSANAERNGGDTKSLRDAHHPRARLRGDIRRGDFARSPVSHSPAHSHCRNRTGEMISRRIDALRYKGIKFGADLIDKSIHSAAVQTVTRFADLCRPIVIQHVSWHFQNLLALCRVGSAPLVYVFEVLTTFYLLGCRDAAGQSDTLSYASRPFRDYAGNLL